MKRTIKTLGAAGVVGSAAIVGGAYLGLVNVGADDPHFPAVHAFLTMAKERSIEVRSKDIEVPNLDDEALIRAGAGNYNAMCIGCHLAPGVAQTELSQALYPAPPDLAKVGADSNPAAVFWVIKHGIKATGMPAWGKSMSDQYIWGMVAFLDQLPKMDARQYQALVTSSGGHEHGGGETKMHNHEDQHKSARAGQDREPEAAEDHHAADGSVPEESAGHHAAEQALEPKGPASTPKTNTHGDGKEHAHDS